MQCDAIAEASVLCNKHSPHITRQDRAWTGYLTKEGYTGKFTISILRGIHDLWFTHMYLLLIYLLFLLLTPICPSLASIGSNIAGCWTTMYEQHTVKMNQKSLVYICETTPTLSRSIFILTSKLSATLIPIYEQESWASVRPSSIFRVSSALSFKKIRYYLTPTPRSARGRFLFTFSKMARNRSADEVAAFT